MNPITEILPMLITALLSFIPTTIKFLKSEGYLLNSSVLVFVPNKVENHHKKISRN
jgi:hypothetical protein